MAAVTTVMWPERHLRWKLLAATGAAARAGGRGGAGRALAESETLRHRRPQGHRPGHRRLDVDDAGRERDGRISTRRCKEAEKIVTDAGGGTSFSLILGAPVPQAVIAQPLVNRAEVRAALAAPAPGQRPDGRLRRAFAGHHLAGPGHQSAEGNHRAHRRAGHRLGARPPGALGVAATGVCELEIAAAADRAAVSAARQRAEPRGGRPAVFPPGHRHRPARDHRGAGHQYRRRIGDAGRRRTDHRRHHADRYLARPVAARGDRNREVHPHVRRAGRPRPHRHGQGRGRPARRQRLDQRGRGAVAAARADRRRLAGRTISRTRRIVCRARSRAGQPAQGRGQGGRCRGGATGAAWPT